MNQRQQERFDAVCREIDQFLFEHSVIENIGESVMNEYVSIVEEVSGKDICSLTAKELNQYKHGGLVADEKAKR